jgi:N-acetylglucosaminyl-diphospho-decaprenol L-rhamnosyltransferase
VPTNIDVVIPIHGGHEVTERCLASLAEQTISHHAIVVDNASPDDSVALLRARFPEVEMLELGANRGYAAACNAGVAAGSGEYVVLLNNDVVLERRFLERLVAPLAADSGVGSAVPVLLGPAGDLIDSAGLAADPTLAGFGRLQGRPLAAAGEARPVLLGPAGTAGAYRRSALEAVGGLDERIFMYQEDLDLALRLRAAGWGTSLARDARGVHLGSATSKRRSARQRGHAGFSRGYLMRRYGVLRGRYALRAIVTEAIVVAGELVLSRDVASLSGRLAGWRAGAGEPARTQPSEGVDPAIDLRASLRLRRADYALASARLADFPRAPSAWALARFSAGLGLRGAARDTWRSAFWRVWMPLDVDRVVELPWAASSILGERPGRILDVASPKLLACWLAAHSRAEVVAIDLWPREIEEWRRLIDRAGANSWGLDLQVADATALPFADGEFDCAYSVSAIEHIPDDGDQAAMAELARVVRPGGAVALTFPFRASLEEEYLERDVYGRRYEGTPLFFSRHYSWEAVRERLLATDAFEVVSAGLWERAPATDRLTGVRRALPSNWQIGRLLGPVLMLSGARGFTDGDPAHPAPDNVMRLLLRRH